MIFNYKLYNTSTNSDHCLSRKFINFKQKKRRKFTSEFKSKVALEAFKERYSLSELAERFELHPNQISQWKQDFLKKSKGIFDKKSPKTKEKPVDVDKLYTKIGKLEVESDYLKKNFKK